MSDYAQRVHRVIDHVRQNLDDDLSLDRVSQIAHFSPFHFHRIFRAVTGETLASFTRRARLERAVFLMRSSPTRALSSIALEVGFPTPSEFSRVFRAAYGVAPSAWDRIVRLDGKTDFVGEMDEVVPHDAQVMERSACRLVYVRVQAPWTSPSLGVGFAKLTGWLHEVGVDWRREALIGWAWDNDKATDLDRLTYDLGITVPDSVVTTGDFGLFELPATRTVEVHCCSLPAIALGWDFLYRSWLPGSRYEPDNLPAMKRFRTMPEQFDDAGWDVDCSIAIRTRWG